MYSFHFHFFYNFVHNFVHFSKIDRLPPLAPVSFPVDLWTDHPRGSVPIRVNLQTDCACLFQFVLHQSVLLADSAYSADLILDRSGRTSSARSDFFEKNYEIVKNDKM